MIVATAGHVDRRKTSLVRALTYLPAADGARIAFVEVPGHERLVRNMAAGVQDINLALLVVAADDGPMPQAREHLQILDRLGAPPGRGAHQGRPGRAAARRFAASASIA